MKLVLFLLLLGVAYGDQFYYSRLLACTQDDTKRCIHWNESTTLLYSTYFSTYFYCLSEHNFVLTREGPKAMKKLTIGDELWSYDTKTGKQGFSKLVAWLHRDANTLTNYDLVQTDLQEEFEASDYHNVAFVNSDGKIDYKFFHDLQDGDELVGFPNNPHVTGATRQVERRGQYTPFTESGNYYIFNSSQSSEKAPYPNDPMILVHSLSQVDHPSSQMTIASLFIQLCGVLGVNRQPSDEEPYVHPLYSSYHFIFGSAWHEETREVKKSPQSSSNHLALSFGSHQYYSSSSSAASQERERQNKMKSLGLAVSILQELPML